MNDIDTQIESLLVAASNKSEMVEDGTITVADAMKISPKLREAHKAIKTLLIQQQGGLDEQSPKQTPVATKPLTEVMASLQLPWPKDVFGEVERGSKDWEKINEFAKTELGYSIDRISATLCRMGWANYERLLREQVNDLVEQGFVISTDVANPQPKLKEELET